MNKTIKSEVQKLLFCMISKYEEKKLVKQAVLRERQDCLRTVTDYLDSLEDNSRTAVVKQAIEKITDLDQKDMMKSQNQYLEKLSSLTVTGSISEPAPGWVDNWYGPVGVMVPIALGICRTVYSDYGNNIDLIPVDTVCNLILVAATMAQRSREIRIYNSCTGTTNPVSLGYSLGEYTKAAIKDGFNILPYPQLVLFTTKKWLIKIVTAIMYLFSYVADFLLQIVRKKPRFQKILTQSVMVQDALGFFTSKIWLIKSPKALSLAKSLSPEDYRTFPCNPQDIVWHEYLPRYYEGVKKYLIEKQK